jgi:DNA polymerase-3 subunit delta'
MSVVQPRPVGQEGALEHLERMAASRSAGDARGMPHALLFAGPSGVGKYPSAVWWARLLKCREGGLCSPACADCKRIAAGTHPDVAVLAPQAPGKAIGIDEVRELIRLMSLKCVGRGPRIAIVRDAHELTHEGQSAFLKLLEEPPGSAVIVLVTENPAGLLQTVRSRCQTVRFGAVPVADVVNWLVTSGRAPDDARRAAALSMGSVGRALSLTPELIEDRNQLIASIEAVPSADPGELEQRMSDLVERKKQGRAGLEELFQATMQRLEAVLGGETGADSSALAGPDGDTAAGNPLGLLRRAERIRWTLDALDRNANAKLAIRDLLLDLENG